MAQDKSDTPARQKRDDPGEGTVTINEDAQAKQVPATADRSEEDIKDSLRFPEDADLGVTGEPEHLQDQTSAPTEYAPADRPPWATRRYDEAIITSAVTGANKHEPPDPAKFTADGRPRD